MFVKQKEKNRLTGRTLVDQYTECPGQVLKGTESDPPRCGPIKTGNEAPQVLVKRSPKGRRLVDLCFTKRVKGDGRLADVRGGRRHSCL